MRHADLVTSIARASNARGYHFGAAIFSGKKIVSTGWCQCKSHPKQVKHMRRAKPYKRGNSYLHAEIHSIISSRRDISGCDIIVARWAEGELRSSYPCGACFEALQVAGIRRCWYFNTDVASWQCQNINNESRMMEE